MAYGRRGRRYGGRRAGGRRYGRRTSSRARPLPKATWSRLARKVGPRKASALARRNPSKAKRLAGGSRTRRYGRRYSRRY